MRMKRFTEEEHTWLHEHIPGHHYCDVAKAFSEKFRPITAEQVKGYAARNKLVTGFRASEGLAPWNKGKHYKASGNAEKHWYRTGHMPHNWKPVGTERVTVDGYVEVKVAEPKTWVPKHRLVWERAHGPIGKNEIIVFLDGDRQNCELENLRVVSRRVHCIINHRGLRYCDPETFDAACAAAELSIAVWAAKRRKSGRKEGDHKDNPGNVRPIRTI